MPRLPSVVTGALTLLVVHGLSAQSADPQPRPTLILSGELNPQYAVSSVAADPGSVFLRRARLNAQLVLSPLVDGYFQAELAASGGGAQLRDAWVRYSVSPMLRLSIGQFKRAFDLFELDSFTDLSLVERDGRVGGVDTCAGVGGICSYSRFTERLGFSNRDLGLRLEGAHGAVGWLATVTNGPGQDVPEENHAKSASGRLTVALGDGVALGGQLAVHDYLDASDATHHASAWAADVRWGEFRRGLLVQAAVTGGDNWRNADAQGDGTRFFAVQGMAAWYAPVSGERFAAVEPLLRLSWGDPDTAASRDDGLLVTPGFMVYVSGKNKVGFNLDVWSPREGGTEVSLKIQSFLHV
jgi:hypothetical protein